MNLGINIHGVFLTQFADDIVLFAKTPEDISRMVKELVGLKLIPDKTSVMTKGDWNTINDEIAYTDEYIYLRQTIS